MYMFRITLFVAIIINLISCTRLEVSRTLTGEINSKFIEKLDSVPSESKLRISSTGGHPKFGQQAAELILEKNLKLEIFDYCFSSCAEYLLPAATSVQFVNSPAIGFHQNPIMIEYLGRKNAKNDMPICKYQPYVEPLKSLHLERLSQNNHWKKVLSKIEVETVEVFDQAGCNLIGMRFRNKLWLPTSEHLQKHYGLNFTGEVCADDFTTCAEKVDHLLNIGTQITIGDGVYVSKGP